MLAPGTELYKSVLILFSFDTGVVETAAGFGPQVTKDREGVGSTGVDLMKKVPISRMKSTRLRRSTHAS